MPVDFGGMAEAFERTANERGLRYGEFASECAEMRPCPNNKGYGMFATKAIRANTLIVSSKALLFEKDHMSCTREGMRKMAADDEFATKIRALSTGKFRSTFECVDDATHLEAVVSTNAWGVSGDHLCGVHASMASMVGTFFKGHPTDTVKYTGLWDGPSRFNHACVPNCKMVTSCDFMFVFSAKDVVAGDELTMSYVAMPLHAQSFECRQAKLSNWGFECACDLCALTRSDGEYASMEREIHSAYTAAAQQCEKRGASMYAAAEKAMSALRRSELAKVLSTRPLAAQFPLLSLYDMEAGAAMCAGDRKRAIGMYQKLEQLQMKICGEFDNYALFKTRICLLVAHTLEQSTRKASAAMERIKATYCAQAPVSLSREHVMVSCERFSGGFYNRICGDLCLLFNGTHTGRKPKIKPNEPCPCASGRKWKKCCGKA